jgi:hypothetical protein
LSKERIERRVAQPSVAKAGQPLQNSSSYFSRRVGLSFHTPQGSRRQLLPLFIGELTKLLDPFYIAEPRRPAAQFC